jgi:hypothetical protein
MFQFNPFTGTLDLNSGPGSYTDDVVEYASLAAFPVPGETGKLYVDRSNDRAYRWPENGTTLESYREISPTELSDLATSFFNREGDAATRPPEQGQTRFQVVLANDSRLIDPRRTAWAQPPTSPFIPAPTAAANLITGTQYIIAVVGDTDWAAIGFPSITKTGNASSGSTTLVVDWPAFGIANGMLVSGTGIQPGTTVTGGLSNTLTISLPTTQAITGSTVTFSNPIVSGSGPFTKNSTPGAGTGSAIPAFGNPEPPAIGTMAYDGSFLYIVVQTPGGQSVRWARTPLSMTW